MFGGESDEETDRDAEDGDGDEDLKVLGDAAIAAHHAGDGLAYAKAIRAIMGDGGDGEEDEE
jgi:hypothetical protein